MVYIRAILTFCKLEISCEVSPFTSLSQGKPPDTLKAAWEFELRFPRPDDWAEARTFSSCEPHLKGACRGVELVWRCLVEEGGTGKGTANGCGGVSSRGGATASSWADEEG